MIRLWTDGGGRGDRGGGWAFVAEEKGCVVHEACGGILGKASSTHMELRAVVEALRWATPLSSEIFVVTDSLDVVRGATLRLAEWKANGWRRRVKNARLWKDLDVLCAGHAVAFEWVKGHNGTPLNELADRLAAKGAREGPFQIVPPAESEVALVRRLATMRARVEAAQGAVRWPAQSRSRALTTSQGRAQGASAASARDEA